jgi:hypothetical protein
VSCGFSPPTTGGDSCLYLPCQPLVLPGQIQQTLAGFQGRFTLSPLPELRCLIAVMCNALNTSAARPDEATLLVMVPPKRSSPCRVGRVTYVAAPAFSVKWDRPTLPQASKNSCPKRSRISGALSPFRG